MHNLIEVKSPCQQPWDKMKGDETMRFCKTCKKNVYNIAGLNEDQIRNLLLSEEPVCVRIHRRSDGTIVSSGCPAPKPSRVPLKVGSGAASLVLAGAVLFPLTAQGQLATPTMVVELRARQLNSIRTMIRESNDPEEIKELRLEEAAAKMAFQEATKSYRNLAIPR